MSPSPPPPRLSLKTSFGMRNIPWSSSHQWLLVSVVRIKEMNDLWGISDFFLSFLCSYLQSCTPRCYASQPAVLSRAGGGAFSSNQQGFLKPVKATDERVHASKCSGEHKLLLPSQSISHVTPHSDLHTQEEWVWWRTNTCIHAGLHKRIHTANIRGCHTQTVETESFTEGGIRFFSQLGD